MNAQPNQLNLASLFQSVAGSMASQKENLNNADTHNHDHGDNMVQVFNVISQAMKEKQNATPADQLEYASQLLRGAKSGSAQVYSQGLSQASKEFQGQKSVSPDNAINLIQALLGGGQASTAQPQSGLGGMLGSLMGGENKGAQQPQGGIGDLLGSLMGGGNTAPQQQQQPQGGIGDILGSLMGGTNSTQGQPQGQQNSPGLDAGDLLNAGMAFMNTKSQGGNNMEAIVNALVSGSAMGNSQHRSQSGALVVNSILQAIGGMTGNK
jgi:hypothetical protein